MQIQGTFSKVMDEGMLARPSLMLGNMEVQMDRRMFVAASVGLMAGGIQCASGAELPSWRSRLLGIWSLVDAFTIAVAGDEVKPWFGRHTPTTGVIIYLDNGWMSAQISGAKLGTISRGEFFKLAAVDRVKWFDEYYAYYGQFEVDEAARVITHRVADSLLPYEKETVYKRKFELDNGVLTLADSSPKCNSAA